MKPFPHEDPKLANAQEMLGGRTRSSPRDLARPSPGLTIHSGCPWNPQKPSGDLRVAIGALACVRHFAFAKLPGHPLLFSGAFRERGAGQPLKHLGEAQHWQIGR